MKVEIDIDEKDITSTMVSYLAEQTERGNVTGWIEGLIYREIWNHPSYRHCPTCEESYWPVFQTRQVFGGQRHKHFRIDLVGHVGKCPNCKTDTIPYSDVEIGPRMAQDDDEDNAAFLAGEDVDAYEERMQARWRAIQERATKSE